MASGSDKRKTSGSVPGFRPTTKNPKKTSGVRDHSLDIFCTPIVTQPIQQPIQPLSPVGLFRRFPSADFHKIYSQTSFIRLFTSPLRHIFRTSRSFRRFPSADFHKIYPQTSFICLFTSPLRHIFRTPLVTQSIQPPLP